MTPEAIKAQWSASANEASTAGTRMHLDIERYNNAEPVGNLAGDDPKRPVADLPDRQGFQQLRFELRAGEAGVDRRLRYRLGYCIGPSEGPAAQSIFSDQTGAQQGRVIGVD